MIVEIIRELMNFLDEALHTHPIVFFFAFLSMMAFALVVFTGIGGIIFFIYDFIKNRRNPVVR